MVDESDETEGRRLYRAQADALAKAQVAMAKRKVQMDRTRMAVAYINQAGPHDGDRQADVQLHAFMSIFHPEVPAQTVREMSRGMRERPRPVMKARRKRS